MRTRTMVYTALTVATLSAGALAQGVATSYFSDEATIRSRTISQVEKQYTNCLRSDNGGVVESALAHLAMLMLVNPACELKTAMPQVDVVASRHPSQETRYKAYLVGTLLRNPGLFTAQGSTAYEGPDDLFAALAGRMHELIASAMVK
jgi:hypothetical protein